MQLLARSIKTKYRKTHTHTRSPSTLISDNDNYTHFVLAQLRYFIYEIQTRHEAKHQTTSVENPMTT